MLIFEHKKDLTYHLSTTSINYTKIGFVPTMGALHEGHLSLIKLSFNNNHITVVSIFINPTQFNNPNDLENYPKTLKTDFKKISIISNNIIIYTPSVKDIYNEIVESEKFDFDGLENQLEGKFREGHFNGVGTIVKKLFEIIKPTNAYFGEKDFQQAQIVKKLVEKFKIPINITICKIVREPNGLALSSRNSRMTALEKSQASLIYQTLETVKFKFLDRNLPIRHIQDWVAKTIRRNECFVLEYFEIADENTLKTCLKRNRLRNFRAFIAVYIRDIRLIDTIALENL